MFTILIGGGYLVDLYTPYFKINLQSFIIVYTEVLMTDEFVIQKVQ